jgi:hypothetical protein
MAINLSDNVHVSAPKPVESKYLNITVPYTGTSQVNTCIASGERYVGLTLNISNVEYWYKTGVTDTALVTKSAGGTWGSITGTLSVQTDLQTCLNGKLASGGTAICATTAGNALCLGGVLPAGYLLSGGTAKNSLCLNGHLEAALSVCNSVCVNGHAEANLSVANSACLGGHLPAYYLLSGGTALCAACAGNSSTVAGCIPSCFLGVNATAVCATCAVSAKALCGCVPASFLLSGGTSVCATTAGNALSLGGVLAACYAPKASPVFTTCATIPTPFLLGAVQVNATGTVINYLTGATSNIQTQLGTKAPLASPNFTTCTCAPIVCATTCFVGSGAGLTGTAGSLKANDSSCLNGVLPAGYLLSGGTAKNSTCLNGHLEAALSVCNAVCVNGHAEAALSVANAACLGGKVPAYYLNTGTTITATNTACLGGLLAACYALIASPVFTGVLCSAGQVINDLTGNGSNAYTIYKVTGTSINMTGSKYNFTGCACDRLDSGTYVYCCHSYNIWTNGISRVTVCGNGYVGIGTTAPEALLHICGVLNPAVGSIAKLDFGGSWNRRILFGICSSNNPHIQSINSAENAYTNLLINPLGGNVGIGTATPLTTLDVNGTLKLRSNNDGAIDSLQFTNLTGETKSSFYLISGDLRYYAGGDKVTFKADGKVGIGTATPTFKFELNGPNAYMHFVNAGTGCLATDGTIIGLDGASDLTFYIRQRENSPMLFYTNDTVRMCIMNSGEVCALVCGIGPDWIATSDCRLKKDIIPISNALSTVVKLQGVCYHLCSDEKCENNIGLIAQDVQKILPEIVSYGQASEEDFKYGICDNKLGLKYDKLSALFIEAFKEQQKQIEENEKQIRALCLELNYMRNYNK